MSKHEYNPYSSNVDYGFVFSDNIADWQHSRKLTNQKKSYEKTKQKRHENKNRTRPGI